MNVLLWVLQVLLAAVVLSHGRLFLFPPPEMAAVMNAAIPPAFRIFIGVAEVLAAAGLTLPGITRILPWLVPSAAAGLMIVTLSATILHGMRNEAGPAITTAILFVVATVVAYMRWKVIPILPRSVPPAAVQ
jgi:uncharacterized membrane protein YphA (DoxX/SURF4 family)